MISPFRNNMMLKYISLLMKFALIILFSFLSLAQEYPISLADALTNGNAAMNQALASYEVHFPDKELWAEAIAWSKEAVRIAPNNAGSLKLQAEVYSYVNWYGPAYNAWLSYLQQGNFLAAKDLELYKKVANKQAYAKYIQDNKTEALQIYEEIISRTEYDKNAYLWAARIALEQNKITKSLNYSLTILSSEEDESAQYLYDLATTRQKELSQIDDIYKQGLELYNSGDVYLAKKKFLKIIGLDNTIDKAWAGLAKASFEQENYLDAVSFYEKASSLKPDNSEYLRLINEAKAHLVDD